MNFLIIAALSSNHMSRTFQSPVRNAKFSNAPQHNRSIASGPSCVHAIPRNVTQSNCALTIKSLKHAHQTQPNQSKVHIHTLLTWAFTTLRLCVQRIFLRCPQVHMYQSESNIHDVAKIHLNQYRTRLARFSPGLVSFAAVFHTVNLPYFPIFANTPSLDEIINLPLYWTSH